MIRFFKRTWAYFFRVYMQFNRDGAPFLAATISYYTLFSIFPLLLLITSVIGYTFDYPSAKNAILGPAYKALPGSSEWIRSNVELLVKNRGSLGLISIAVLLWSGTNVFAALEHALNRIFRIERPLPFWHLRFRSVVVLAVSGLLFLLSSAITSAIPFIDGISWLRISPRFLYELIGVALSTFTFFFIYSIIPGIPLPLSWRSLFTGALVSGLLWELTKRVFAWYLSSVDYTSVYGPVSSVVILLFWLYISASLLLLGAEVAADEGEEGSQEERPAKGGQG